MVNVSITRSVGRRDFVDIRADVLKTLIDCIENRFSVDQDLINLVEPFIQFTEEADIRQIHETFGAELSLANLDLEYNELVQLKLLNKLNLTDQIKRLISHDDSPKYNCVLAILCRIKACTPQAADVERSIKANNLFKTSFRNRLNLSTENKYMYLYYNMPPLELWDPRETIVAWLNNKRRRDHTDLPQKSTFKKRTCFKGIYADAADAKDSEDDDDTASDTDDDTDLIEL